MSVWSRLIIRTGKKLTEASLINCSGETHHNAPEEHHPVTFIYSTETSAVFNVHERELILRKVKLVEGSKL